MRLFLLVLLGLCAASEAVEAKVEVELLRRSVEALSLSVEYMESQSSEINLDGALGCHLTAEFLQMFLAADLGVFKVLGEEMRRKFIEIQQRAKHAVSQAIPYVQKSDPKYFHSIGALLFSSDTLQWFMSKTTDPKLRETQLPCAFSAFNESMSDECFQEIIGSRSEQSHKCDISDSCLLMEMRPKQRDYILTHQVLFFQLLEAFNCLKKIEILNESNLLNLRNYFCANVMRDAEKIVEADFPYSHQDLFMEQVGLCGLWGYSDFYRPEWLEKILEWQTPRGCFRRARGYYCTEDLMPDPHVGVKREEKFLPDGCLSHKTSVAMIALAVSIRFCAESVAADLLPNLKPWQDFE